MQDEEPTAGSEMPLSTIRVETALSRYPVHRLARKGNIRIDLNDAGQQGEMSWKVSYNSEYGQPGPLAYKLDTLIINRRIEEATRPIPRILKLGSLSDICRELNLSDSGKNRSDLKKSLFQNAFAGIKAKTRYRQGDGSEQTLEAGFTRYSVILTGEKLPDGRRADGVYVVLNDVFISVINGAMTRPLDYDYLKSLSPGSQRFYELLSYQMYAALKYERPCSKLVYSEFCAHAPQARHLAWERVRSQMNKIHRPHRQSGYIDKVEYQQATDKGGRPDWVMLYTPGPRARAEYRSFTKRGGPSVVDIERPDATPEQLALMATPPLVRELIRHGVTATKAEELVRGHSEEKISAQMERLEWLIEKKSDKIADPAAYLVGAIVDDYAPPRGFVSKSERQRRSEAKLVKERLAAEGRRRQQESDELDKAEKQAVEAYWDSLNREEQDALDIASMAHAGDEVLALERGVFKRLGQQLRRHAYIRRILEGKGANDE